MIEARVQWILRQLGSAEPDQLSAARSEAYSRLDPLVASKAKREAMNAFSDATNLTRVRDEPHIARLALLERLGVPTLDPDDTDAVARAFDTNTKTHTPPKRFGPTLTLLVALMTVAIVATLAFVFSLRPKRALTTEHVASRDAFEQGGRPQVGDEDTLTLFAEAIPEWVMALDSVYRALESGRTPRLDRLELAREQTMVTANATLGRDTASFLLAVIEQAESQVIDANGRSPDSHLHSVDAFNRELSRLGLGFYLDAFLSTSIRSGREHVLFATFRVNEVTNYQAGDTVVRALVLERVDTLRLARAMLGFTREQISDALVLEERIESHLVRVVLPSLASGERMRIVDEDVRDEPWAVRMETLAAEDARNEVGRLSLGMPELSRVAEPLRDRRELMTGWRRRLSERFVIPVIKTFDYDVGRFDRLRGEVLASEWRTLTEAQERLEEDEVRATYATVANAYRRSIERHEVQHQLDYRRGPLIPPPSLEWLTGTRDDQNPNHLHAISAVRELSAYLSELARGPVLTKTNLAHLAIFAFDRSQWGSAETHTAIVILQELYQELTGEEAPRIVVNRRILREVMADVYIRVREATGDELRAAAGSAYARLFERELDSLSLAATR